MDFSMTEMKIEVRKLIPSEGMTLTNGESFSKEVWLGKNVSPDGWYEITDEEAEKRMKELEAEAEAENE